MLPINKQLISINYSKGVTIKPQYIVNHETDNTSRGANAMANRNYFANHPSACASTHFIVDDKTIVQCAELNWKCWHVGDDKDDSDDGCNNGNSIGIEICVNVDGDYEKAKSNAIELNRYLMSVLDIDIDHVVTHNFASGKWCPSRMLSEGKWQEFKNRIIGIETPSQPVVNPTPPSGLRTLAQAKAFVGSRALEMQQKLNKLNYSLDEDGIFGNLSYKALIDFQRKNSLVVDALCGSSTFAKMDELIAKKNSQPKPQPQGNYKVKRLQEVCNIVLGSNLDVDGIYGNLTDAQVKKLPLSGVAYTNRVCTRYVQEMLGIDVDGIFLYGTEGALKKWQSSHNKSVDGIAGYNSYKGLALE